MKDWHVGQKVACVSSFGHRIMEPETYPVTGEIYTVRDIDIDPTLNEAFFRLEEIVNAPRNLHANGVVLFGEKTFWSGRFRPIKTTSIDCFLAILTSPDVEAAKPTTMPA